MRTNLKVLSFGFAAMVLSGAPVHAGGDYDIGGMKDYAGVPVPAPIPVPLYEPVWYFRADIGVGFASEPNVSADGAPFGLPGSTLAALTAIGYSPGWLDAGFDSFVTGGVGIGRRVGRNWRLDFTFDYQSLGDVNVNGQTAIYELYDYSVPPPVATGTYAFETVDERVEVRNGIWMVNGYYDFSSYGPFTPYLGAGIGFSVNRMNRSMTSTDFQCDIDPTCAAPVANTTVTGQKRSQDVTVAASAMVGVSYDIGDITTLDLNYRYMHIGGFSSDLSFVGVPTKIEIDDVNEHQLRAGLRFNVF